MYVFILAIWFMQLIDSREAVDNIKWLSWKSHVNEPSHQNILCWSCIQKDLINKMVSLTNKSAAESSEVIINLEKVIPIYFGQ